MVAGAIPQIMHTPAQRDTKYQRMCTVYVTQWNQITTEAIWGENMCQNLLPRSVKMGSNVANSNFVTFSHIPISSSQYAWTVRHITLSFVIGWWCHLRKRWSGGLFGAGLSNVKKNHGRNVLKYTKHIYKVYKKNYMEQLLKKFVNCDVYPIFKQKSTCNCIAQDL